MTIKKPQICLRQTNWPNTDTVEEYFKKIISIPFLDQVLQEFRTSFTDLHKCVTLGLLLAPSKIHSLKKIDGLFTFFLDGIPQPYSLITEINRWCMKWPMIDDKPDTLLPNYINYFKISSHKLWVQKEY